MLGELSIYKRLYKGLGYSHSPNAAGFDFTGPAWVQIKTTKVPESAYQTMKTAVDDLVTSSPADKPLKLHILIKPGTNADSLKTFLETYILGPPANGRVELAIEPFELTP